MLNQLVASSNDATTRPRRGRFNPKIVRAVYSGATDASNDSALILFSSRGLYEAVDSGLSRHHFSLRVPGVAYFTNRAFTNQVPAGLGWVSETTLEWAVDRSLCAAMGQKPHVRLSDLRTSELDRKPCGLFRE